MRSSLRCRPCPRAGGQFSIWAACLSASLPLCLALASGAGSARAQSSVEHFDRQLEQLQRDTRLRISPDVPAGQRAMLDWGAFTTLSYLSTQDANHDTHVLRQFDVVGYGRVNIDGAHEFFAQGRATYRDWGTGDSLDGHGDRWFGRLEQAWYRFDLARYKAAYEGKTPDYNLTAQVGRQYVTWGNALTLSEYIDGGVFDFSYGQATLEVLAGVTPTFVVDFDASRPSYNRHTSRGFYGAMASVRAGQHKPYIFGLIQRDYNPDETVNLGFISTRFDYNSWYLGAGSTGSLSDNITYGIEAVYEGGSGLSNSFMNTSTISFLPVDQTKEQIQAFALDAKLDYLLKDSRNTRLGIEGVLATGDRDRINTSNTFGGNQSGTRDHAFNAFGLVNTGLAFSPEVSNLAMLRIGASTFPLPTVSPFRRLQVGADLFLYSKFQPHAPVNEPTHNRYYLGFEPDLFVNWQVASDVSLAVRYGVFFPGSNIASGSEARQFLFVGLSAGF